MALTGNVVVDIILIGGQHNLFSYAGNGVLDADDASSVVQFKSEGDEHLTVVVVVLKSSSIYLQVAQKSFCYIQQARLQ